MLCLKISAQQTYHFNVEWNNNRPDSLTCFRGKIDIQSNMIKKSAYIHNISHIPCPNDYHSSFINNYDINFKCSYGSRNNKSSCEVTIIPYFLDSITNTPQLITGFDVTINTDQKSAIKRTYNSNSSILSSGKWYRYNIYKSGVYMLTPADLTAAGINIDGVKISQIKIYAKKGYVLDEIISDSLTDNPSQIPLIRKDNNNDNIFNNNDQIIFYVEGPNTWTYNSKNKSYKLNFNAYSDTASFYLNISDEDGINMQYANYLNITNYETVNTVTINSFHKNQIQNFISSGKWWYGENITKVDSILTIADTFEMHELPYEVLPRSFMTLYVAANAKQVSYLYPLIDDKLISDTKIKVSMMTESDRAALPKNYTYNFINLSDNPTVKIVYSTKATSGTGWLDRIECNLRSKLTFNGKQFSFSNPFISDTSQYANYIISDPSSNLVIFNINNPLIPKIINGVLTENGYSFKYYINHTEPDMFIAFDDQCLLKPAFACNIANQDLLSISANIDYLILSPKEFNDEAEKFGTLHEKYDGYTYKIVSPNEMYNEYTCGQQDVTAIREFIRTIYEKSNHKYPKFVLLIGGTSYDYKNITVKKKNMFPTFECMESLSETDSFGSDDYFVILDEGEGDDADGITDIPLGRIPFDTINDIDIVYNKIEHYIKTRNSANGLWRHNYVISADDDSKTYVSYQEQINEKLDTINMLFNIDKIYIDAFVQEKTLTGYNCPEGTKKLLNDFNNGSLVISYFGHGSKLGWAAESFLDVPTIQKIDNYDNMPFVCASTCEFFQFDFPGLYPAGKQLLGHTNGGTFSIISTSRLSLTDINKQFQRNYTSYMNADSLSKDASIGKIFSTGKNMSNQYSKNVMLFGDPAVKLNYPNYGITIDSINNQSISNNNSTETIHALDIVKMHGNIKDKNNKNVENFNGYIEYQLFDQPSSYSTLNTTDIGVINFNIRDRIINRGKVKVINGNFTIQFRLSDNIIIGNSALKLDMYAYDTVIENVAGGSFSKIYTSTKNNSYSDDEGPEISGYINSSTFEQGDLIPENSTLYILLHDNTGIYSSNYILGNDITLTINDETNNTIVLNSYFRPTADDYQSGTIQYPLDDLTPGKYTLLIKAYDLCKNYNEYSITFTVTKKIFPKIINLYSYPNPAKDYTYFCFSHNFSSNYVDINIELFDINSKLVTSFAQKKILCEPNTTTKIYCNLKDMYGNQLQGGIYFYRLRITSETGNYVESSNKIFITK